MEGVCDHAGDEEQEYGQKFEVCPEDGAAARLALVLAREYALYDELVGAPVPEAYDGGAYQCAEPGEVGVAVAADKIGHGIAVFVDFYGVADTHHFIPSSEFLQSEHKND